MGSGRCTLVFRTLAFLSLCFLVTACVSWHNPGYPDTWSPASKSASGSIDFTGVYRNSADKCTVHPHRVAKDYLPTLIFALGGYSLKERIEFVELRRTDNGVLEIAMLDANRSSIRTISYKENEDFFVFKDRIEIRKTKVGGGGDTPSGYHWRNVHLYKNAEGGLTVRANEGFVGRLYFIPATIDVSQWCQYSAFE
jgi:hypothetical protein